MSAETLISYNRPLTRSARRALKEYGIVAERAVNEFGHWTEVDVEECPPEDLLEEHELAVERGEPERVFVTGNQRVEIHEEEVLVDGVEQDIPPDEAIEHAEAEGWEEVEP